LVYHQLGIKSCINLTLSVYLAELIVTDANS
jgi:hypothetical protein